MMGATNLIADTMDCGLSYSIISHLKKLSQQVCCTSHLADALIQRDLRSYTVDTATGSDSGLSVLLKHRRGEITS